MNSKIANLIALELGILIAILAWLAFSNLSSVKQYAVAEEQARTAGSFATVAPGLKARNQHLHAADLRAERGGAQQEDEEQAPTVRQYDQEIAMQPSANSNVDDDLITGTSPYYAGVDQEPVVNAPDYLVSPLDQIVVYAQPNEIIVFSNARFFVRPHRATARFGGARMMVTHRRPGGGELHPRGGGLVAHRNTNALSFRPSQGVRPR